jgi:hypothetical protein
MKPDRTHHFPIDDQTTRRGRVDSREQGPVGV